MYITRPKQFKWWQVTTTVGHIIVVGVLTHYALLHFVSNLKATQMNMQHSLICELSFTSFEQCYNTTEATKNICCTVTRWLKYFTQVARTNKVNQS